MTNEPGLGEQALSKAAEMGISRQLDEVENLNVEIRTDPLKLMQGKVDSVTIQGEGMVMQEHLRVEALEMVTSNVAVNPLSALVGKIELTEPTAADARVVLHEDDLNRAFNSDYLISKMQNVEIEVQGQPKRFDILAATLNLLGDSKASFSVTVKSRETDEVSTLAGTTNLHLADDGQRIALDVVELDDRSAAPEVTIALFKKVMELADLRNFELQGIELRLRELSTTDERMILQTETQISELPTLEG